MDNPEKMNSCFVCPCFVGGKGPLLFHLKNYTKNARTRGSSSSGCFVPLKNDFCPCPLRSKVDLWFFVECVVGFARESSVDLCLNMSWLRFAFEEKSILFKSSLARNNPNPQRRKNPKKP